MLATSYLLAFQSAYIPDGFLDHVLSLRGCAFLSQTILSHQLEGVFSIEPNMHGACAEWKMENFPALDQQLASDGLHSISRIALRLATYSTHKIERALITQLAECIRPLLVPLGRPGLSPSSAPAVTAGSDMLAAAFLGKPFEDLLLRSEPAVQFEEISWDTITEVPPDRKPEPLSSFNALIASAVIISTWPHEEVLRLFSPSNVLGSIVLAHFCCVRFVIAPLSVPEPVKRAPMKALVEWMEKILDAVEDDDEVQWTKYVEWPQKILTTIRYCLNQKRNLTFGDLHDILINDPAVFREGRLKEL